MNDGSQKTDYYLYDTQGHRVAHLGKKEGMTEPFKLNLIAVLNWAASKETDRMIAIRYRWIMMEISTWQNRINALNTYEESKMRGEVPRRDVSNDLPYWPTEILTFKGDGIIEKVESITIPTWLITTDELFGLIGELVIKSSNAICGDDPNKVISVLEFRARLEFPESYGNWSPSWKSLMLDDLEIEEASSHLLFGLEGLPVSIAQTIYG